MMSGKDFTANTLIIRESLRNARLALAAGEETLDSLWRRTLVPGGLDFDDLSQADREVITVAIQHAQLSEIHRMSIELAADRG
jgi:hypothetical protein